MTTDLLIGKMSKELSSPRMPKKPNILGLVFIYNDPVYINNICIYLSVSKFIDEAYIHKQFHSQKTLKHSY